MSKLNYTTTCPSYQTQLSSTPVNLWTRSSVGDIATTCPLNRNNFEVKVGSLLTKLDDLAPSLFFIYVCVVIVPLTWLVATFYSLSEMQTDSKLPLYAIISSAVELVLTVTLTLYLVDLLHQRQAIYA